MIYLGLAGTVGGIYISQLYSKESKALNLLAYCFYTILAGLIGTISYFFIQVGAFSENGLMGMIQQPYLSILWQSNVSSVMLLQAAGFILALGALALIQANLLIYRKGKCAFYFLYIVSCLSIAASFPLSGHTTELNLFSQFLLALHILMISWWLGSLWPLWKLCQINDIDKVKCLMEDFGRKAILMTGLLIVSGAVLAIELVGDFESLFYSEYGQVLLTKIFFVSSMLLLAAQHKLWLVPQLKEKGLKTLSKSISIELLFASLVLFSTLILSTFVGP